LEISPYPRIPWDEISADVIQRRKRIGTGEKMCKETEERGEKTWNI
jgi:hypothetical protein